MSSHFNFTLGPIDPALMRLASTLPTPDFNSIILQAASFIQDGNANDLLKLLDGHQVAGSRQVIQQISFGHSLFNPPLTQEEVQTTLGRVEEIQRPFNQLVRPANDCLPPVINLAEERRIREILYAYSCEGVPSNGEANIETYVHTGLTYTVIALKEHYSEAAIRLLQDLLKKSRPRSFIVEGIESFTPPPEVQYALEKARALSLPIRNVIVTPYNKVVADLAGLSWQEAVKGIIAAEIIRYERSPEIIVYHMAATFERTPQEIDNLFSEVSSELESDKESVKKKYKASFDRLVAIANNLSWYQLQQQPSSDGEIIALVGGGHAGIFNVHYVPTLKIDPENVNDILKRVSKYESNLVGVDYNLKIHSEADQADRFFSEVERLKDAIHRNPHDRSLFLRLEALMGNDYERRMKALNGLHASHRAEVMIEIINDLLSPSQIKPIFEKTWREKINLSKMIWRDRLRQAYHLQYQRGMHHQGSNYRNAAQVAKNMRNAGFEEGPELQARALLALRDKSLNLGRGEFAKLIVDEMFNEGLKEWLEPNWTYDAIVSHGAMKVSDWNHLNPSEQISRYLQECEFGSACSLARQMAQDRNPMWIELLKKVFRTAYQTNLDLGNYCDAAFYAQEMIEAEITEGKSLKWEAMRLNFENSINRGQTLEAYVLATQMVSENIPDANEYLKRARSLSQ